MSLHSNAFRGSMPEDLNWHWRASPDTLRGVDSWHMKHCIITHTPLDPCYYHFPSASKKWPRRPGCELQINLDVCQSPGCAARWKCSPRAIHWRPTLPCLLWYHRLCWGWCRRCRHWTEKASSLGERVVQILSKSATRYSSTAYICVNGNPAHWQGSLKCDMYVRAWAKRGGGEMSVDRHSTCTCYQDEGSAQDMNFNQMGVRQVDHNVCVYGLKKFS